MEISSETHRLDLDDAGTIVVYPLQTRQLHVSEYRDGRLIRDEVEASPDAAMSQLLTAVNSKPLFAANWAGGTSWNIDLDCGFQRWNGVKTQAQVRIALKRCGFSQSEIKTVINAAKREENSHVRRYW